ncbi:MAG TPA: aminotransferase class III-fold pyridoxal phosphate-dependent enzyme [Candidatus Poseidoniales archaeon]|jgi:acetylornithine/succinyldiaminopimelate/putrescine aminotransferase|nr:MAG: lysine 6-aminotransferase [Euryarchaeota archaeon]HIG33731.1 aminotransferase class III-fold pyridoxal phosphate-dependent enzyme [Candidatus Poseidoniales archaeon]HIL68177.1 aminotransferase class III-fold pyridoxal phosphate-dependent enzyme [Candidatus Poseidoniales archaeon]
MVDHLATLTDIRSRTGQAQTNGLNDSIISDFLETDPSLSRAIEEASGNFQSLINDMGDELFSMKESDLGAHLQTDYVNFYSAATVNPYVAIAARGPWIITSHGAVLHDNGGYGMLGMGHGPDDVILSMQQNWVMANVMTPSFSQKRFSDRLRKEVGHKRGSCPFFRFVCLNSGSESVTISIRIADANTLKITGKGGKHEGKPTKMLALVDAFHGRTHRPAQISDSCSDKYEENLASFRERDNVIFVPNNDLESLSAAFDRAEREGFFIELMAMEPVMGEGNPGLCVTRGFYDLARSLCSQHGSMLIVDSIQAGLRGQGCLSIVDYDGFEDCLVPDMETWSKALNAGQYPLSVVGLSERAAELYVVGIYGNTMTTNPRALETAVAVLDRVTPELRQNIKDRGVEFVSKLRDLADEIPDTITEVIGTGLLLSAELNPEKLPVVGFGCVEEWCRNNGLGVIHGGQNALRFTPHFAITTEEIDMILGILREAFLTFTSKTIEAN